MTTNASLIGHQGRCFDLKILPSIENNSQAENQHLLLSSSEDGTAKIWNPNTKRCIQTFQHNKSSEVLRSSFIGSTEDSSILCTAGSDGKALLWKYSTPSTSPFTSRTTPQPSSSSSSVASSSTTPQKLATLQHRNDESQIYVCESHHIHNHLLLTAADNEIFLWDICQETPKPLNHWSFFLPDPSIDSDRVLFGGEGRNPNRESYVFDAKWHPTSPQIFASLFSDNTMKILDIRSQEIQCNLNFPKQIYDEEIQKDCQLGHPTTINFASHHSAFEHLCTVTFGSGHVGLLDLRKMELLSLVRIHSKPCYGSIFRPIASTVQELGIFSWSSDSSICKWAFSFEQESEASSQSIEVVIDDSYQIPSFSPLVCCQASANTLYCGGEMRTGEASSHGKSMSFMGTPIYILNT